MNLSYEIVGMNLVVRHIYARSQSLLHEKSINCRSSCYISFVCSTIWAIDRYIAADVKSQSMGRSMRKEESRPSSLCFSLQNEIGPGQPWSSDLMAFRLCRPTKMPSNPGTPSSDIMPAFFLALIPASTESKRSKRFFCCWYLAYMNIPWCLWYCQMARQQWRNLREVARLSRPQAWDR